MRSGLQLHLSGGSTTGYKGVRKHTQQAGRFEARRYAGSRTIYIGVFDSAVEAAVAYARAVGQAEPEEEEEEKGEEEEARPGGPLTAADAFEGAAVAVYFSDESRWCRCRRGPRGGSPAPP